MTKLSPLLALDADPHSEAAHQRADARNNMFVTAVLYGDRGPAPVRIRNMSRSGALIESTEIPAEGSKVRLSRGSLSVRGQVVWLKEDRAGIRFDAAIAVADWLPRGNRPDSQQQVDDMIHACRSSAPPRQGGGGTAPVPATPEAIRQLLDLKDALAAAAGELAGDPAIAVAHPTALQAIDVAAQKLERLALLLAGRG
jgi:hypothetical protein